MDKMKSMMIDLYKFIAGPTHGNVDEQTGIWKEIVNPKVKPLKEIRDHHRSNRRTKERRS